MTNRLTLYIFFSFFMIYFLFELFQADKAQVSLETWYDI